MGFLSKIVGKGGSYSLGARALGIDDEVNENSISGALLGKNKKSATTTPYADMLSEIQAEQQKLYDSTYRPLAQSMIKDVNSTALVDTAKSSASIDRTAADKARADRQRLRMGVPGSTAQQSLADYTSGLNRTLTNDGNINNSRVAQEERNQGVREEMINISRGIATSSINSALNAASGEGNRNSTNANIATQNANAKTQTTASIASMAAMALMMFM